MRPIILIIPLIFSLVACSSATNAPADTGIEGQVFIGPTCPVEQVNHPCPDKPYQATLSVLTPARTKILEFQADTEGHFRIALAPGDYILHPESPNVIPHAAEQTFTVVTGQFTHLTVTYDSGIR